MKIYMMIMIMICLFCGCREEITPPDNPAGNINQPIKKITRNSYTFIMNAKKAYYNNNDYINLKGVGSKIYFSIDDYSEGDIYISLINSDRDTIYRNRLSNNVLSEDLIQDYLIPSAISINLTNFTGKFIVELYNYK